MTRTRSSEPVGDQGEVSRPAAVSVAAASIPELVASASRAIGPARATALARAVGTGAPLSNRGVGRMLSRIWDRTDDYFLDPDRPYYDAPVATAAAPATAAPVAPPATSSLAPTPFREEILNLANQIDAKGVLEQAPVIEDGKVKPGTGGIGKWVDQSQLDANRKAMGSGFTTCGTVLSNI